MMSPVIAIPVTGIVPVDPGVMIMMLLFATYTYNQVRRQSQAGN
jgi:hypothetical protein